MIHEEIGNLKIALIHRTHIKHTYRKVHLKYFQNLPDNICEELRQISLMNRLTHTTKPASLRKESGLCSGVEVEKSNKHEVCPVV